MSDFTLHELQCFDAVVRTGTFQAAARALHRSHPAVFAAVAKLERQLGLELLDRRGYRVHLTDAGRSFHQKAQPVLREHASLRSYAAELAMGQESEISVVIGDVCPRPQTLALLSRFFETCPATRLHLFYEAVTGPVERLLDDEADLIIHRIDKSDPRLEWIDLCKVQFVPVVAPGFLPFAPSASITPEQLRGRTQCVIRDTARHSPPVSHFIVEGANQCVVPDQLMKKEIILHGVGWGHMPAFLVGPELRRGRLRAIMGRHLPGRVEDLVAARRQDRPHGPVATRLWSCIGKEWPAAMKRTEVSVRRAG